MGNGEKLPMMNFIFCIHSPNIVRVIKTTKLRWAGHLTKMDGDRNVFKILVANPTGKRSLRSSADGRTMRKLLSMTYPILKLCF